MGWKPPAQFTMPPREAQPRHLAAEGVEAPRGRSALSARDEALLQPAEPRGDRAVDAGRVRADYQLVHDRPARWASTSAPDYLKINPAGKLPALGRLASARRSRTRRSACTRRPLPEANLAPPDRRTRSAGASLALTGRTTSTSARSRGSSTRCSGEERTPARLDRPRDLQESWSSASLRRRAVSARRAVHRRGRDDRLGSSSGSACMWGNTSGWRAIDAYVDRLLARSRSGRPHPAPTHGALRGRARRAGASRRRRGRLGQALSRRRLLGAARPLIGGHWVIDNRTGALPPIARSRPTRTLAMSRFSDCADAGRLARLPGHARVREWF